MRFRLDAWQSDYAFPYEPQDIDVVDEDTSAVDVTVEAPAHEWEVITPEPAAQAFPTVRFVDGVQRSDAVVWITDPGEEQPLPGLVASWAAGVITSTPAGATLDQIVVERGVFSDARSLGPIMAANLTWRPQAPEAAWRPQAPEAAWRPQAAQASDASGSTGGTASRGDEPALRERLGLARRRLEDRVGRMALDPDADDSLVVYDGLLHALARPLTAVGLAKRAHRTYLPPELNRLQRVLRCGQRTPLFSTDEAGRRLSFYLALADPLPPAVADPGSCVARVELSVGAETTVAQASAFADRVALTLPRFATEPHADPRAPQNLMPIRSLEDELRRMLGRSNVIRPLLAAQAAQSNAITAAAPSRG